MFRYCCYIGVLLRYTPCVSGRQSSIQNPTQIGNYWDTLHQNLKQNMKVVLRECKRYAPIPPCSKSLAGEGYLPWPGGGRYLDLPLPHPDLAGGWYLGVPLPSWTYSQMDRYVSKHYLPVVLRTRAVINITLSITKNNHLT